MFLKKVYLLIVSLSIVALLAACGAPAAQPTEPASSGSGGT